MTTVVNYDHRALTIDGERTLLISGAIHYPRSTPAMWPDMMRRSRAAGLNAVETYVFWNLHERERGVFDFSGRLDLLEYCRIAQEHDLYVILRIGPYICAEINYGGFPAWLRDVPGIQMRTYNEPFMQEMARWVRHLVDYMRPMFAPQGGPIILAQIENEYGLVVRNYGEAGQKYQQWAIDFSLSLELGIPWVMCVGGAPGAIETLNGFYAHTQIDDHFANHPDQPAIWTENWPGWYDVWGYPHRQRTPENVAYAVARFIAAGGTGVNYYMWHGGTNFGREAMCLQTTSYDYTAPLDEFGLPTAKLNHLARLHGVLTGYASALLADARPPAEQIGVEQHAYAYHDGARSLVFLCNDALETAHVTYSEQEYALPPRSVTLLGDGRVLMNTAGVAPSDAAVVRSMNPTGTLSAPAWRAEPLPTAWPDTWRSSITVDEPVEQLQFTHDRTDYCWYTTKLVVPAGADTARGTLRLTRVADIVHVFVDDQLAATTDTLLKEVQGDIYSDDFAQSFDLTLSPGVHELGILCCALGLIKGDWQLGFRNMVEERKGLWGPVTWNGEALSGPWHIQPGLLGERGMFYGDPGALLDWEADQQAAAGQSLRWWRMTFKRPTTDAPLALDLNSMGKGLAWLNGKCIGRYWLIPGVGDDGMGDPVEHANVGEPTQRYYHLPAEWLAEDNVLVLLEEQGGDPADVRLCAWR